MRTCPTCQYNLSDQAVFCDNCGLSLQPVTPGFSEVSGGTMQPLLSPNNQLISGWVAPAIPEAASQAYPPRPVIPQIGVIRAACTVCGQVNAPAEVFCGNCGMDLTQSARNDLYSSVPVTPQPIPVVSSGGIIVPPRIVFPVETGGVAPIGLGSSAQCPSCGHTNLPQAKYCDNCGLSLVKPQPSPPPPAQNAPTVSGSRNVSAPIQSTPGMCAACGHVNAPGEMFCQNCGVQLAPVGSIPPPLPVMIPQLGFILSNEVSPQGGLNQPEGEIPQTPPEIVPSLISGSGQIVSAIPVYEQSRTTAPLSPDIGSPPPPVPSYRPEEIGITGRLVLLATNVSAPLPVGKNEITIGRIDPGRNAFPDIDLTPHQGESGGVSRMHARLTLQGGLLVIEDLQSTNGTLVNKQKLQAGQRFPLKNGDEIRFGRIALVYYSS